MRFEYLTFLGLITNVLLSIMFPTIIFSDNLQEQLEINSQSNYNTNNDLFTNKQSENIDQSYIFLSNTENTEDLVNTDEGFVSTLVSGATAFFDSVFNAIKKIGFYFSFLIPFGVVLYNLPGVLGFFMGTIWFFLYGFSFVNWLRGR